METLSVRDDGHLSPTRESDSKPSLIVTLFTERSEGETSPDLRGPSVEEFYRLLSDVSRQMPDLSFQVSEDQQRQSVTYSVERASAGSTSQG